MAGPLRRSQGWVPSSCAGWCAQLLSLACCVRPVAVQSGWGQFAGVSATRSVGCCLGGCWKPGAGRALAAHSRLGPLVRGQGRRLRNTAVEGAASKNWWSETTSSATNSKLGSSG